MTIDTDPSKRGAGAIEHQTTTHPYGKIASHLNRTFLLLPDGHGAFTAITESDTSSLDINIRYNLMAGTIDILYQPDTIALVNDAREAAHAINQELTEENLSQFITIEPSILTLNPTNTADHQMDNIALALYTALRNNLQNQQLIDPSEGEDDAAKTKLKAAKTKQDQERQLHEQGLGLITAYLENAGIGTPTLVMKPVDTASISGQSTTRRKVKATGSPTIKLEEKQHGTELQVPPGIVRLVQNALSIYSPNFLDSAQRLIAVGTDYVRQVISEPNVFPDDQKVASFILREILSHPVDLHIFSLGATDPMEQIVLLQNIFARILLDSLNEETFQSLVQDQQLMQAINGFTTQVPFFPETNIPTPSGKNFQENIHLRDALHQRLESLSTQVW